MQLSNQFVWSPTSFIARKVISLEHPYKWVARLSVISCQQSQYSGPISRLFHRWKAYLNQFGVYKVTFESDFCKFGKTDDFRGTAKYRVWLNMDERQDFICEPRCHLFLQFKVNGAIANYRGIVALDLWYLRVRFSLEPDWQIWFWVSACLVYGLIKGQSDFVVLRIDLKSEAFLEERLCYLMILRLLRGVLNSLSPEFSSFASCLLFFLQIRLLLFQVPWLAWSLCKDTLQV